MVDLDFRVSSQQISQLFQAMGHLPVIIHLAYWFPCSNLVAICRMTWESPSKMMGSHPCWVAMVRPDRRPLNSATLLEFTPMYPQYIPTRLPSELQMAPPNPVGPGFPLEAPLKFSLYMFSGGGSQVSGLILVLFSSPQCPIYSRMLEISQFLRILVSSGPAWSSKGPHLFKPNDSLMWARISVQASSDRRLLSSKIQLFLSF